jgi:CPA1 family monovalent cation:H+ antiporter
MLLAITVFAIVSRFARIPYPIVMLAGGALVALIPGLRPVSLAPDVVFLVLLPLLLFAGAWTTDFRQFKAYLGPIMGLALGLVFLTTIVIAYAAHAWMGLPLASAFVLGAIVSPSDAIATEAIADEVAFPAGAEAILSGESLVNDAAALVIFGFAVTAVSSGTFSLASAALAFAYVTCAGIGIGLAVAVAMFGVARMLRKSRLDDDLMGVLLSLVTPFLTYLPAQAAQASGVLATVSGGVFLSARSSAIFSAEQRIAAAGVWTTITFALNGFAFVLVGLQLRSVFGQLSAYEPAALAAYALGIAATIVILRFSTVFPFGYLRWKINNAKGRAGFPSPPWGDFFITGWSGMRGIVTLAGALAIPANTASGLPFPGRALILFLAFTTIVITLVGQGLTLPWIARRFGSKGSDDFERDRALARAAIAIAARERLRELEAEFTSAAEWEAAGRLTGALDRRIASAEAFLARTPHAGAEPAPDVDRRLLLALCAAERTALERLRRQGKIGEKAFQYTQYDIDLAETLFRGTS